MAYSVKLKNQMGTEVIYNSIEKVTIPLSAGTGDATFVARYYVTKTDSPNITYIGGGAAANSVDYVCHISTEGTGKKVPDTITVKIGGTVATIGTHYTYTKHSDTEATVFIVGSQITGYIVIEAVAVSA